MVRDFAQETTDKLATWKALLDEETEKQRVWGELQSSLKQEKKRVWNVLVTTQEAREQGLAPPQFPRAGVTEPLPPRLNMAQNISRSIPYSLGRAVLEIGQEVGLISPERAALERRQLEYGFDVLFPEGVQVFGETWERNARSAGRSLGLGYAPLEESIYQAVRRVPELATAYAPGFFDSRLAVPIQEPKSIAGKVAGAFTDAATFFGGLAAGGAGRAPIEIGGRFLAASVWNGLASATIAELREPNVDAKRFVTNAATYFGIMAVAGGIVKPGLERFLAKRQLKGLLDTIVPKGVLEGAVGRLATRSGRLAEYLIVDRADDWVESVADTAWYAWRENRDKGRPLLGTFLSAFPAALFWNYLEESAGGLGGMAKAAGQLQYAVKGQEVPPDAAKLEIEGLRESSLEMLARMKAQADQVGLPLAPDEIELLDRSSQLLSSPEAAADLFGKPEVTAELANQLGDVAIRVGLAEVRNAEAVSEAPTPMVEPPAEPAPTAAQVPGEPPAEELPPAATVTVPGVVPERIPGLVREGEVKTVIKATTEPRPSPKHVLSEIQLLRLRFQQQAAGARAGAQATKEEIQQTQRELAEIARAIFSPADLSRALPIIMRATDARHFLPLAIQLHETAKKAADVPKQIVSEAELLRLRFQQQAAGARAGAAETSREIRAFQKELSDLVRDRLPAAERGKAFAALRATTTAKGLEKNLEHVEEIVREWQHREAITELKQAMRKMEKSFGADLRAMPEYWREKVEELLEPYDPATPREETLRRLFSLKEYMDRTQDPSVPEGVREELRRLTQVPFSALKTEAMREMAGDIHRFTQYAKLVLALRHKQWVRARQEETGQVLEAIYSGRKLTPEAGKWGAGELRQPGLIERWFRGNDDLHYMLKTLGGGAESNPLVRLVYDKLREGEQDRLRMMDGAQRFVQDIMQQEGATVEDLAGMSHWTSDIHEVVDTIPTVVAKGRTANLTAGQRIALALTLRDPDGRRSLQEGVEWTYSTLTARMREAMVLAAKGKLRAAWKAVPKPGHDTKEVAMPPMSDADAETFQRSLTPVEQRWAEVLSRLINEHLTPVFADTMSGLEGYSVETKPDHFPKRTVGYWKRPARAQTADAYRTLIERTLESLGVFHPRAPGAKAPVHIADAFEVTKDLLNKTAALANFAQKFRDIHAVLDTPEVKKAVGVAYHPGWLKNINERLWRFEDGFERGDLGSDIVDRLRGNIAAAIIPLRVIVMGRQVLSAYGYLDVFPLRDVLPYLRPMTATEWRGAREFVQKWNPIYWQRIQTGKIAPEIGDWVSTQDTRQFFRGQGGVMAKVVSGVRVFDEAAILMAVPMSLSNARQELGSQATEAEVEGLAAKKFDDAVRRTQPGWHPLDRTLYTGSQRTLPRMLSMFQSYFQRVILMQREAWQDYRASPHNISDKLAFAKTLLIANLLLGAVSALYTEAFNLVLGRKRPARARTQNVAAKVATETLVFNLRGYFILGPIASAVQQRLAGWQTELDPVSATFGDVADLATDVARVMPQVISGERYTSGTRWGEYKWKSTAERLAKSIPSTIGRVKGIPIEGLIDAWERGKATYERVATAIGGESEGNVPEWAQE